MANEVTTITLNEAIVKSSIRQKSYVDTNFQKQTDELLETDDKTIIGAINEINKTLKNGSSTSMQLVFNAATHYDFPSVGSVDVIYKAYNERKTYQWNADKLIYETLDEDGLTNVSVINGGDASGTN